MKLIRKTAEEIAKIQREEIDAANDASKAEGDSTVVYHMGKAHALRDLLTSCENLVVTVDSWGKCFID